MNLKKILKKLYYVPSATLNTGAKANMKTVSRFLAEKQGPVLLNIGSGDRFLGGSCLKERRCPAG